MLFRSALRVVTPAEVDKTVLVSGSGTVCQPAGPYLAFLRPGFCKAYVVSRATKGNLRVITTRVLKTDAKRGETGLSVETLDPLYFVGGTAKLKPESERLVKKLALRRRRSYGTARRARCDLRGPPADGAHTVG